MVKPIGNSKLTPTVQVSSTEPNHQQKTADRVSVATNRQKSSVMKVPPNSINNITGAHGALKNQPQPSFFASALKNFLSFFKWVFRIQTKPDQQVEMKQLNPQAQKLRALGPDETKARLQKMIEFIEQDLAVEGLFRLSGNSEKTNVLFENLTQPGRFELISPQSVHNVTVAMKKFIGACDLFGMGEAKKLFLAAGAKTTENEKKEMLQKAIAALPGEKRELLKILLNFLGIVVENSEKNQMNSENLGRMFGPNMLMIDYSQGTVELDRANAAFKAMIEYRKELFPEIVQGASLSTVQ